LQENKIPIFEREGWQSQPSLSKIGILLIRRSLISSIPLPAVLPGSKSGMLRKEKHCGEPETAKVNPSKALKI